MIRLEVEVEARAWSAIPDVEAWCQRAADAPVSLLPGAPDASATVLLTDDSVIRDLNREWRGKDAPTNVLSFPSPARPGPGLHLGDIAIAFGTVAAEARAEGKSLADHTAHLVIHGLLHLLAHDHETETEADAMEDLEIRALALLGIADPYGVPA